MRVAVIPSVSGGLGHLTRVTKLIHALQRADRSLDVCMVLPELGLRATNLAAAKRSGHPVRVLPNPVRHERDAAITKVLGDIDVVIEDTERRLIAYRRVLPRVRTWISIPMLPIWDELFMDWPLLEHADRVLYTYPAVMPVPEELARLGDKLTVTGPILDPDEMPPRNRARSRLGFEDDELVVWYAPRDFPFGRWFGLRVLNGVVGGFLRARAQFPGLRLVLTAVADPSRVQPPRLPRLDSLAGLTINGIVSPEAARDHIAAADLAIVEGTSTLFDAAVAGTPVLMVPGLIYETSLEGTWVHENDAGIVLRPEDVTRVSVERVYRSVFGDRAAARARADRLRELVGEDGCQKAVDAILGTIASAAAP
ncbi:MAG TPA: hypothetical protein VIK65_08215 [Candidatus Limnocylindrales bacterium]